MFIPGQQLLANHKSPVDYLLTYVIAGWLPFEVSYSGIIDVDREQCALVLATLSAPSPLSPLSPPYQIAADVKYTSEKMYLLFTNAELVWAYSPNVEAAFEALTP